MTVFQGCRTINLIILYDKKVPTVCFVASCQNPDLHVENLTKATLFLLMKVKEESEKVGVKLKVQKTKIMASGPITSWEIDGETVKTVTDFILGVSKFTADGDCSQEI